MRHPAALLLISAAAGCATVPPAEAEGSPAQVEPSTRCDAAPAQGLVGRPASQDLAAEAMRLSGATALRWIPHGMMVTMEYREGRLNIALDSANTVIRISCG